MPVGILEQLVHRSRAEAEGVDLGGLETGVENGVRRWSLRRPDQVPVDLDPGPLTQVTDPQVADRDDPRRSRASRSAASARSTRASRAGVISMP